MGPTSAREMALKIMKSVEEEGAYANLALNKTMEHHRPGKLDRAFVTELVYGALRSLNTLDWVLGSFLRQPLSGQTLWVRNILRLGAYQILYMDRVPDSAACNESAELARKYAHAGAVKFVNGVLRNVVRNKNNIKFPEMDKDPVGYISLRHSHPAWLVERWLADFGLEETRQLCRVNNEPAPNTVRTNTLKTSRQELFEIFTGEGLRATETCHAPEGLNIEGFAGIASLDSFKQGYFQVQDESSMLVGHAAGPQAGWKVLDAAGAPGGKTTHLAQLMQNRGEIIAFDIHPHKIGLIEDNCRRLGIECVRTALADAREIHRQYAGQADLVLLDAPCSGLGVLRRRPDIRWRKDPAQFPGLVKLQEGMLASASQCVKSGGVLVYSTCTINDEENLGQVEKFLKANSEFELDDLRPYLPAGLDREGTLKKGYIQILPHHHGMDGFFISRLRKKKKG